MSKRDSRLPIRTRNILDGEGDVTASRSVLCPARGESVALGVCSDCASWHRIEPDRVTCRPESTHPTMRWSSMLHRMLPSSGDRVALAEVMSRDVICVRTDVSIESLTALFLERGLSGAAVVDGDGAPIGMVSKTSLVREQRDNGRRVATVGDIMMPVAFALREDEPLSRGAAIMAVEGVHHLPVLAADGRVVGMLSSLDVVRWVAAQSGFADQA